MIRKRRLLKCIQVDNYTKGKKKASNIRGLIDKNWRLPTLPPVKAVPSAQVGLTSLFGKGRGGPHRYNHHKILNILKDILIVRVSHKRVYGVILHKNGPIGKLTGN